MRLRVAVRRWRNWFPTPSAEGKSSVGRWVLLEADRMAVTGALLTFVFVSFLLLGTVWTFEMQTLLTRTSTVQTILDSFLSGMILLVSIVVSINSIVLNLPGVLASGNPATTDLRRRIDHDLARALPGLDLLYAPALDGRPTHVVCRYLLAESTVFERPVARHRLIRRSDITGAPLEGRRAQSTQHWRGRPSTDDTRLLVLPRVLRNVPGVSEQYLSVFPRFGR